MSNPGNDRDAKPAAKLPDEEDVEDLEAPASAQEDVVGGIPCRVTCGPRGAFGSCDGDSEPGGFCLGTAE